MGVIIVSVAYFNSGQDVFLELVQVHILGFQKKIEFLDLALVQINVDYFLGFTVQPLSFLNSK